MLHDELVMLLAGYQSVLKETGEMHIANIHAGIDYSAMDELFRALSIDADEQKIWMKDASPVCEKLIDAYWPAIKKLAELLFQNGQMFGAQVEQFFVEVRK
jgi:hypothetical protein